MAQVPEQVLAWLYKVLHDYQDVQRTYSDAARTLSAYPTLTPRTEIYTYDSGSSALLLTLSGTLPVSFRGTIYRFPVKLWLPRSYPQEAPMAYVTPAAGKDMVIRPGQHVGVDGRVYHPYLRDWESMWDRASVAEFLEFLQQVFEREPPVISRAAQAQLHQRPIGQVQAPGGSAATPRLPPKQRVDGVGSAATDDIPPPRPPKPGEESTAQPWPQRATSRDVRVDGPPLPPLPHEMQASYQRSESTPRQSSYWNLSQPQQSSQLHPYQHGRRPVLPLPPDQLRGPQMISPPQQQQQQRSYFNRSPVSPLSPSNGGYPASAADMKYAQPPPLPASIQSQATPLQQQQQHHPRQSPLQVPQYPQQQAQYQQPYQQAPPPTQQFTTPNQSYHPQHPQHPQTVPQQMKKQPPPDLLSDPFDVALPTTSPAAGPAPPIPPNPEKQHLLHALSQTLTHQAQQKAQQNLAALGPLQAQHQAIQQAQSRLEAEIRQLSALDATISTNEAILHRSMAECDRIIKQAKSKPEPVVDELLVAPTMVANQLWTACAEEAACREAMYVLQKAVDKGRVSGEDFVRQMRGLGRERFLRLVLARKCAMGLGLERP